MPPGPGLFGVPRQRRSVRQYAPGAPVPPPPPTPPPPPPTQARVARGRPGARRPRGVFREARRTPIPVVRRERRGPLVWLVIIAIALWLLNLWIARRVLRS